MKFSDFWKFPQIFKMCSYQNILRKISRNLSIQLRQNILSGNIWFSEKLWGSKFSFLLIGLSRINVSGTLWQDYRLLLSEIRVPNQILAAVVLAKTPSKGVWVSSQTCLDFEWSKRGWVANGLDLKCYLKSGNPTILNPDKWTPICHKPFTGLS